MIVFDDNELEIALITYNRSKFVQEWFAELDEKVFSQNKGDPKRIERIDNLLNEVV